jgi:DNA-directed RNA polymerase specialized sigma24 family protein
MAAVMAEAATRDETQDAHIALEAWGRWARSALSGLGWSASSVLSRVIELGIRGASQSGPRSVEIDETCEMVDRAIMRLDGVQREVVMRTYLQNDAAQVTAKKCGITYGYYRSVLHDARRRIADYLSGAKLSLVLQQNRV